MKHVLRPGSPVVRKRRNWAFHGSPLQSEFSTMWITTAMVTITLGAGRCAAGRRRVGIEMVYRKEKGTCDDTRRSWLRRCSPDSR